jgi:hypothetical protein
MPRIPPAGLALAAVLGQVTLALAQTGDPRQDLEVVARALDLAVSRVSRPVGWTIVPEDEAALSYHVAGFGAIFVVAPRAIPARTAVLPPEGGSAISRVVRVVEQTLQQAESPETRERLQKTLEGLRRQQEELNARAAAQERDRAAIQRLTQERLARRAREAAQGVPVDSRQRASDAAAAEAALRNLEAEAAAFQRQAEASRQAADTALAEVARELRERLGGAVPGGSASPEPALAGPGEAPLPSFVPPPPWRFWAGLEPPREDRPTAMVVGEVREAVTSVLEAKGAALRLLGPQDLVLVTVDFVPQGGLRLRVRPERTLVVRVRKKELEERAAGSLDGETLRRRIEYLEY